MKCEYGCNQEGHHTQSNGKMCCSSHRNSCPSVREKNSRGLRIAHKEGRLTTSQLDGKRGWSKGKTAVDDTRIRSSSFPRRKTLTAWVLASGVEYRCYRCRLNEWQGERLTLELDHINGNGTDDRLENLRFACPNCHSLTPTYRGRNKNTNRKKVSNEDLLRAIRSTARIADALRMVGLTPKGGNYKRCYELLSLSGGTGNTHGA